MYIYIIEKLFVYFIVLLYGFKFYFLDFLSFNLNLKVTFYISILRESYSKRFVDF